MESLFFFLIILFATGIALPAGNGSSPIRIDLGFGATLNKLASVSAVNSNVDAAQRKVATLSVLIPERPKGREHAVLEVPHPIQQKDLIYDYAQQFVANIFHRKPIVDTISEHEKYGNTGDQFRSIGNAVVGGYETLSNILNTAVDFPFEKMKEVTRQASTYLTAIGAKIVGL